MSVKIEQGDFAALQAHFLPWAEKNKGLSHFFTILKAAKIREASVESRGPTLKDLGHLENITVKAEVQDAVVRLPFLDDLLRIKQGSCRLYQKTLFVEGPQGPTERISLNTGGSNSISLIEIAPFSSRRTLRPRPRRP